MLFVFFGNVANAEMEVGKVEYKQNDKNLFYQKTSEHSNSKFFYRSHDTILSDCR
jgi:hypothetical protein